MNTKENVIKIMRSQLPVAASPPVCMRAGVGLTSTVQALHKWHVAKPDLLADRNPSDLVHAEVQSLQ